MVSNISSQRSLLFYQTFYHEVLFHLVLTSCCRRFGGMFISSCMSCSRAYARGECLKCPTICLPLVMASLTARCDRSPSLITSCIVCATQPKLRTLMLSIAFRMLLALSLRITWTLLYEMCHLSNISVRVAAIASPVCDPRKLVAFSIALCGT